MQLLKQSRAMLVALFISIQLTGCAMVTVDQYAGEKPALDFQKYFNGPIRGWGMFQDRGGKVTKRFIVDIDAKWNGDTGTLDEHFVYADGTKQQRIWTVRRVAANRYIGTAPDVIGEANGEVSGNAIRWQYVLAVPVDGRTYHVDMDDWMFLMDDKVMLNKTTMRKFGFRLGEVTLSFEKR